MKRAFLTGLKKDLVYMFALGSIIVFSCHISITHADPALTPYTYYEDFEDGSVGPWASYPPAQDTAYDPTIWVKPLYKEKDVKNRALYREALPRW